ncbi:hypothetical protein FEM48_Zijuj08G0151600 [Ziziphus jujuba var. spinosa]|uniref:Uncharacterized protein n=1 Tax=Ziziphus jujuba var. spinosa TaxID=714518 RepID=A0A978UZU5_ZIZJJ|nr:hypothetical protein FEM48_Zijuj08G0151600 [Ziziphus jujuba var. spinosa]
MANTDSDPGGAPLLELTSDLVEASRKSSLTLVGKIISEKEVKSTTVQMIIRRIWFTQDHVRMDQLGSNIFLASIEISQVKAHQYTVPELRAENIHEKSRAPVYDETTLMDGSELTHRARFLLENAKTSSIPGEPDLTTTNRIVRNIEGEMGVSDENLPSMRLEKQNVGNSMTQLLDSDLLKVTNEGRGECSQRKDNPSGPKESLRPNEGVHRDRPTTRLDLDISNFWENPPKKKQKRHVKNKNVGGSKKALFKRFGEQKKLLLSNPPQRSNPASGEVVPLSRCPPSPGFIKINCDASVKEGSTGIEVVMRNHEGRVESGFEANLTSLTCRRTQWKEEEKTQTKELKKEDEKESGHGNKVKASNSVDKEEKEIGVYKLGKTMSLNISEALMKGSIFGNADTPKSEIIDHHHHHHDHLQRSKSTAFNSDVGETEHSMIGPVGYGPTTLPLRHSD